jgi:hypothetical protein
MTTKTPCKRPQASAATESSIGAPESNCRESVERRSIGARSGHGAARGWFSETLPYRYYHRRIFDPKIKK